MAAGTMAAATVTVRFADLRRLLRPHRRGVLLVLLLVLADTALASLGVGIVLPVLQSLLEADHSSALVARWYPDFDALRPNVRLVVLTLATVALFAVRALVAFLAVRHSHRLLHRLRFDWVERIGVYYLRGPFRALAGRMHGELLNDWFNETLAAMRFCQAYLTYVASGVFVVVLIALGLLVEWRTTIALIVLSALVGVAVRRALYSRSSALSVEKLRWNQAMSAGMVEDLANLREIKLMGAERQRLDHLRSLSKRLGRTFVTSAVIGEVPRIVAEFAGVAVLLGMILVGTFVFGLDAEATLPLVVFFSVAFYRLVTAASQLVAARVRVLSESQSLLRVTAAVEQAEAAEAVDAGLPLSTIETDIVMRDVTFAYGTSDPPAVRDVTLALPRGKVTYLVGPSGAGKSTLLDLLLRLVPPDSGAIEVNGHDAASFRLRDWRRAFGYVSQNVSLFNGTIDMNLRIARPEASEADITEACRLAGADGFISQLPQGFETPVGDRGHSLSGGQRKRVAIARALLGAPSVLVLDEATQSFEQALERDLLRNLKASRPELTLIQVTHRMQSLEAADWLVVMERGRIVACGPSEQVQVDA